MAFERQVVGECLDQLGIGSRKVAGLQGSSGSGGAPLYQSTTDGSSSAGYGGPPAGVRSVVSNRPPMLRTKPRSSRRISAPTSSGSGIPSVDASRSGSVGSTDRKSTRLNSSHLGIS